MGKGRAGAALCLAVFLLPRDAAGAGASQGGPAMLNVPFLLQSEELCGGAAAAMVLRYWGERGIFPEDFASLLDARANGIRGDILAADVRRRGWTAQAFRGDDRTVRQHLERGRPLIALIEDRPGRFHYVVLLAWPDGHVVLHDPARSPFRMITEAEFQTTWAATNFWTLLVLPDAEAATLPAKPPNAAGNAESAVPAPVDDGCRALVSRGVDLARAGDRPAAAEVLSTALSQCPASALAARELAGVRFVQSRWHEAAQLAARATAHAPDDVHAWRLLAASRFIQDDVDGALRAWNRIGEPQVDLVRVEGLDRTHQTVVQDLLGLEPRTELTVAALQRARRRLALLPAASATRVDYRPLPGGRAEIEATVIERPPFPGRMGLITVGAHALIERELLIGVATPAGSGVQWNLGWRWWEERPRIGLAVRAPAVFGRSGLWHVDGCWERQSYDVGRSDGEQVVVEDRRRLALGYSDWMGADTRVGLAVAFDRWDTSRDYLAMSGSAERRLADDRLALRAQAGIWPALGHAASFGTGGLGVSWRSGSTSVSGRLSRFTARAGLESASASAPFGVWPGADVGHARAVLARAHPLLREGVVSGGIVGRTLAHGGMELRTHTWARGPARLGVTLFSDVARAWHTLEPTYANRTQIDVGVGFRVSVPGEARTLRLDVAHGLRDGRNAISVGWQLPWPHER
jgi:hypothetical protein